MIILKLFFSKALDLLTRYPLQIILVLVCVYAFWQKTRYEAVKSDYEAYKVSVQLQADMQKAKNEILRKQAQASVKEAELIYDNNLKAIKNEYLKKQKLDSVTIGNLRNKLRDKIAADSFRVPEAPSDTETNPEVWRERYSTLAGQYDTLKYGTALTTSDFNLCRQWADIVCKIAECENPVDN